MTPRAYSSAVKSACRPKPRAFTNALVTYDVAMGTKRATAVGQRGKRCRRLWLTSEERYRDLTDTSRASALSGRGVVLSAAPD